MAIDISDPRFDDYAPDEADATPVRILPIIADDNTTVLGFAAFVVIDHATHGEQVTGVYPTISEAAQAAEREGYDPYMSDSEIDEEHEALEHGDWPF